MNHPRIDARPILNQETRRPVIHVQAQANLFPGWGPKF